MSQFNSIFSPLTNKLARLAGITLLAVAALFASTQQMSAQSCVQNLTVSLDDQCQVVVTPAMVTVGTAPAGAYVQINDESPSDLNIIKSVSPATGFTYGLFNASGQLICQGTIISTDFSAPIQTENQLAEWQKVDTVVMWSDDIENVLNKTATWNRDNNQNAQPTGWKNGVLTGSASDNDHLAQELNLTTYSGNNSLFVRNGTFYTGRPYFYDRCELQNGSLPREYRVFTLDVNGAGSAYTDRWWENARGNTSADSTSLIPLGLRIQVKVTDDIEYNQCQPGYYAKLSRKFQFIDQRGNDTTVTQIIFFQRPEYSRGVSGNAYARVNSFPTVGTALNVVDRGPKSLGQFGPFGTSIRRPYTSKAVVNSYGQDVMADSDADGKYNLYMDTIAYNLSNQVDGKCVAAPGFGKTDKAAIKADLLPILKDIYTAVDTLPSGVVDSISLWDMASKSNYSVDFDFKKFDVCNNGVKYEVYTTVLDWCNSSTAPIVDTILLKFSDESAPKAVALVDVNNDGSVNSTNGIAQNSNGTYTIKSGSSDLRGQFSNDSVIVSVGLNDCTASLRLPRTKYSDRGNNGRDLAALFNWNASDNCSGDDVTYSYRIQSRDVFNSQTGVGQSAGQGYLIDRATFTDVNYTIAEMGGSGTPTSFLAVLGLPIGEHRLIVEAWDKCYQKFIDTLYFDVQDMVAPTMKCDDQLNITLTSNSSTNWYINGNGAKLSDRELGADQRARITVADINEGSRDNCTLDSMYVRRMVDWEVCKSYLVWNMDYDIFGNNNGTVDKGDFDAVDGSTTQVMTPKYMQYVEFFCCDGAAGNSQMVELWGADLSQGVYYGEGTGIPGAHNNSDSNVPAGRNWSWCWGNVRIEDKTEPVIYAPDLTKTYNVSNTYKATTRPVRDWVSCSEKEIIGTANSNKDGDIANEAASNLLFGVPDIYGLECKGSVVYTVSKSLTCDTGFIDRIWTVTKELGDGKSKTVQARQRIWVQAHHDFTITVPADATAECTGTLPGNISFNENGCDLLAVSAVNEKVYAASDPSENVCKKIYRTWTVINWCMVPNQFNCSTADPANYARVIPRLRLNPNGSTTGYVSADATATTLGTQNNGPARSVIHRVRSVVSGANNDIRWKSGENGNWNRFASTTAPTRPVSTSTGLAAVYQPRPTTGTPAPFPALPFDNDGNRANGWSSNLKSDVNYPRLNDPNPTNACTGVNDQTFAWTYTQVVKITDTSKPKVDIADATSGRKFTAASEGEVRWDAAKGIFAIRGATNCTAKVKFTFTVTDGCVASGPFAVDGGAYIAKEESPLTAVITSPSEFSITPADPATDPKTFVFNADGLAQNNTTGRQVYHLVLPLRDDCGNLATERIPFTVGDLKAPAPVCVQNLTATLMPDGSGGCMVVVKAIDVFQDINRDWNTEECTPSVKAEITKLVNGVEGAKAATLTLTGADKGGVTARVYLTDGAGNSDFCTVTINVEDNICGGNLGSAAVAGAIQTESKATVEGVQVNLSGQTQKSFATGVNGLFVFNNLTAGADYTVTPSLNKGFLNGVSTFDLVLISKHILGVQPLNTPYKLIAADVNNSKSVTTLDLIQLRKLILNIDASFANNTSWRFVDASYTFPNASNPWAASFPEVKNVNDLEGSLSANFVAIKVGDVNGNAIANSTQGSVRNLTSNLGINVADMNLVAGNEYKVDFTAADLNGIEGFQFTLNLDKKGLELVDLVPGIAAEENFGIFAEEGVVTASWNGEAKGGVLFSLVVRAKSNTTLSEVLNLNSRYTAAEAYKGGEVVNVGLNFNASKASANYELYQNTPNPFAGESIIGFNLPVAGAATLTIQDVTGRTLKVINGQYAKGYNQVSLKSTELSATGVLTYTLKAADFTATRKMIIVE